MKKQTSEKYTDFLRNISTRDSIPDIRNLARQFKISDSFVNFLIKKKYLKSMAGGSFKLIDFPPGFFHQVVHEYENVVKESRVNATHYNTLRIGTRIDSVTTEPEAPVEQRERQVVDLLGAIMRDNPQVQYSLTRIQKTTKSLL